MFKPFSAARNLSRRHFLGAAAAATLMTPLGAQASTPKEHERWLSFRHIHTGEKLKALYWAEGEYIPESLGEIDTLLADFRSGDVHPIDIELLDLLYRLRQTLDSNRPFHVISGYRSPTTNATLLAKGRGIRKNSLHMRGMAIDIRLPGRDTGTLWHAAIAERRGGTGFYPKYNFVHVDVGPHWHWCKPSRCEGGKPQPG
jgi:uncharacterized protein YcbK (DUF882 family)